MSPRLPKVKGVTEAGLQQTQALQSRISTTSTKQENPHFLIKRKSGTSKLNPMVISLILHV
jgi:hypothetical protein